MDWADAAKKIEAKWLRRGIRVGLALAQGLQPDRELVAVR
jgi:hypothetical protein